MPTVYLPTEHSEAELALAGRVADALECSALYVTWSSRGYEDPDCEAVIVASPAAGGDRRPAAPEPHRSPLARAFSRAVTFLAAAFAPPDGAERERRADGR